MSSKLSIICPRSWEWGGEAKRERKASRHGTAQSETRGFSVILRCEPYMVVLQFVAAQQMARWYLSYNPFTLTQIPHSLANIPGMSTRSQR